MKEIKRYTSNVIRGQEYYLLPQELIPSLRLEIKNNKKKSYDFRDFNVFIRPNKILKTDSELNLYYENKLKKN